MVVLNNTWCWSMDFYLESCFNFPFSLAVISGGRMIGVGIIKVVHTVQSWGGVDLESSKLMRMNI